MHKINMPVVTKELVEALDKVFRPLRIKTDTPMTEIQRAQGQQDVLEYIKKHVGVSSIKPDDQAISDLQDHIYNNNNRLPNNKYYSKLYNKLFGK